MIKGWSWLTGGASATFKTIQTPAGTSPVATGPNDILTLTSSDNSITITGNSTTDTIDLVSAGGSPGGSNTNVQFNDSGTFNGESDFIYDKTRNAVGIQTTDIDATALQVKSSVNGTVSPPSGLTATLVPEVVLTPGTPTPTVINPPTEPTIDSITEDVTGSGFQANCQTIFYEVYGYVEMNGAKYVTTTFASGSVSDSVCDGTSLFVVNIAFTPGANSDGYAFRRSLDGFSWSDFIVAGNSSPIQDNNSSNGEFLETFDAVAFTADGTTHYARAYNFGPSPAGVTYYSTTYNQGSYTDPNDGSKFAIRWDTTGGSNSNYKIVGAADQTSFDKQINSSSFFENVGFWNTLSPAVVTPAHYGYQAGTADFPRTYTLYNSKNYFGSSYYSASTSGTILDPGGSDYYAIDVDWTNGTNTTGYKLLRSPNPLGASGYTSGTAAVTKLDEKIDSWNVSSTLTPTSVPPTGMLIEHSTSSLTDPPYLELRASGGSKYGSVSITDPTGVQVARTGYDGNYNIYSANGVHIHKLSTGLSYAQFDDSGISLNSQGSTTGTTTLKAGASTVLTANNTNGSLSLGNPLSSTTVTVLVQAANSAEDALEIRRNSTSTQDLLILSDSASLPVAKFDYQGGFLGRSGTAAAPGIGFTADPDTGFFNGTNILGFTAGGTEQARLSTTGLSIKTTTQSAKLQIAAGSTSANSAPIKLMSGSLMTTAEAGAIEFLTDKLYFTITTGAARKEKTLNDIALTSGRVPFVTTNGRLTDDADMTFATDTLTVTKAEVKPGTASDTAKVGGSMFVNATAIGNVGTGEDDLRSYSVPANTLATTLDRINFSASGTIASSVNAKRIKVKFGATTIFDTGAAGIPISAAIDWVITGQVIRTGATTQKCFVTMNTNNATLASYADYATAAETLSGAVTLKLTAEAVSNDDVVQETMTVDWMPNNT